MQTNQTTRWLRSQGHDIAISAFFGVQGARADWGDIPIYPNNEDNYGARRAIDWYQHWNADILMSLTDVWVLKDFDPKMRWYPWTPVDHNPIPPRVVSAIKDFKGFVKPIAMARYGERELKRVGIDCYYVPHGIDCQMFAPLPKVRKEAREKLGWEDKFVVGTVATNTLRKNWNAAMRAMQKFVKTHPRTVWYMHTTQYDNMGFNLHDARIAYELHEHTFFPPDKELRIGIPQETLRNAYNAMDVFLLPSKGEGFGLPSVEAQACGVPVIISDNTAQTEMCGSGWLLKEQIPEYDLQDSFEFNCNSDEILQYLDEAYDKKKLGGMEEMRHKARLFALQYDAQKVFTEYWTPIMNDITEQIKTKGPAVEVNEKVAVKGDL